jgi:hypothetical protein
MKNLFLLIIVVVSYSLNAQDSKFSLGLQGGMIQPTGSFSDFSQQGMGGEINIRRSLYPNLSVLLSAGFETMPADSGNGNWQKFGVNIGPQYRILNNKISMDVFAQVGYASQHVPGMSQNYRDSKVMIRKLPETNFNSMQGSIGIKLGYAINSKISLYVKPQYNTSFNDFSYQSRDISPAINDRGELDIETANNIQFQRQSFNTSNSSINVGIDINFANDWNSTRSNKTSKTT